MVHQRCREPFYTREKNIRRYIISDDEVSWDTILSDYKPTKFTSEKIINSKITDPEILNDEESQIKFNQIDNKIDRRSFEGIYKIVDGLPRNPGGRTGLTGRGCLYYWGPNHAADPVVTTWKRNSDGNKILHPMTKKPILKFVAIFRKHDNEWALPGGMVDPGELVSATVKREFSEEALNTLIKTDAERKELYAKIDKLFINGETIYQGYVDDPRNTDNSWMETVAINFHDEDGDSLAKITLEAGDDATAIKWIDLSSDLKLYASHLSILQKLIEKYDAHW